MSHDATNWAIKQRGLKPALKVVLWNLCDRYHPDNGCFPSQETLAEDCEVPRSTLNVYLETLEQVGLIAREQRRQKGSQKQERTRYRFAFEAGFTRVCADKPSPETGHGDTAEAESRNEAEPSPENGNSRVQNLDSNLVREPVSEPVNLRESASEGFEKAEGDKPQAESREATERSFRRWFPTWPSYVSDSEETARKEWFDLSPAERVDAATRQADYLDAARSVGRKVICSAAVYLRERRWTKLAAKPAELAKAETAAPMGKAWMATRFATFHSPKGPMPRPVIGVQMDLDAGGERAENAQISRNELYAWPKIRQMNERFRNREPWRAPADMVALGQDFVSVDMAGVVGQAWKRLHRRMLLPWLPFEPKYAYFPAIDPNEKDLDKAVAAAFWGIKERIEGHERHAAE